MFFKAINWIIDLFIFWAKFVIVDWVVFWSYNFEPFFTRYIMYSIHMDYKNLGVSNQGLGVFFVVVVVNQGLVGLRLG